MESSTTLHIKNMVCNRCVRVAREELEKLGLRVERVKLGEAEIAGVLSPQQKESVRSALKENGFELLEDHRATLVDQIKTMIIKAIHYADSEQTENYSDFLARKTGYDYHYLSSLFPSVEGITIEKYIIAQKVERVKELLAYDELTVSEIAFKMGYSSVAHLSGQFKKTTGLTPSAFKKLGATARSPLDDVHPQI